MKSYASTCGKSGNVNLALLSVALLPSANSLCCASFVFVTLFFVCLFDNSIRLNQNPDILSDARIVLIL